MKQLPAVFLAILLLFSLSACGGTDPARQPKEAPESAAPAETGKPTEIGKPTETGKPTEIEKPTESEKPAETGKPAESDPTADQNEPPKETEAAAAESAEVYTIADEVIVDDENCAFIIKKAEVDPVWGFTLKAYCENKTSDKTLMFSLSGVSVNGYMADPLWAEEVAPGKKSNDAITFSSSDFDRIGITSADEISFTLRVYDSDDWGAEDLVCGVYTVYPTGLSADAVVCPERKATASEQVIVDNDAFCFIILGQRDDSIWGYTLDCYMENRTDTTLVFSWDDVGVNGYMIDPYWMAEVTPGMRKYGDVSFSSSDLDEIGITSADEISFILRVYVSGDWFADDLLQDRYTVYPTGLSADAVVRPERKTTASEQVVVDNDEFCFIILGQRDDSIWGYTLDCYIENRTDASLTFAWDSVSVNGYMIDPYWATGVAPGMRKYSSIDFSSHDFEENGIAEVEEIEYFLRVYDYDNWSVDDTLKETLVLKP